jgi:spore germination protein
MRAAAVGVAAAGLVAGCGAAPAAKPMPRRPGLSEVVGFWATGTHTSLAPAPKFPRSATMFSPLFYTLAPGGAIASKVDPAVAAAAARLHWPVAPVVNLAGAPAFLGSVSSRLAVARGLAALVRHNHYAGLNLDFEPAPAAYKAGLASFVIDLHDWLPKTAQRIYLDVVPTSGVEYNFSAMTPDITAYILMAYDQHDSGSVAGPVAATSWVSARLHRLLSQVPASKVDLGLAFYGYRWVSGSTVAKTLPLNAIPAPVRSSATYNAADQEMTGTYVAGGTRYVFWYETPQGISAKIKLAEANHLRGVAVWRFGYQTSGLLSRLQAARS